MSHLCACNDCVSTVYAGCQFQAISDRLRSTVRELARLLDLWEQHSDLPRDSVDAAFLNAKLREDTRHAIRSAERELGEQVTT